MKIIILGAGRVGSSVATDLVNEDNDITIVDTDSAALQNLSERYDLRTIQGHASYPSILEIAGAKDADMLIALTNSDEHNMIACQIAYTLFHIPTKIARIRSREYLSKENILFSQDALPVDVLIRPEQIVTQYIQRLIDYPGALQVVDFAEGKIQMIGVQVANDHISGIRVAELNAMKPNIDFRIMMIFRAGSNKAVVPNGDTIINIDDEIYIIVASKYARELLATISPERPVNSILIAGGGHIGMQLAKALEDHYTSVKLIEIDPHQAQLASEKLKKTVVLHGDAADQDLLVQENINSVDVFCALTSADEANILSAMLAKSLQAKKVITLINRPTYVDLVQEENIDIAISPQSITIGTLLAHIRRGDVVAVHSLRKGIAEAIEAIAHGDEHTSRVVGRSIDKISLPPETNIGAIVRNGEMLVAHHDNVIEADDHVILLVSDRKNVPQIEDLFQVGITFL